MRFTFTHSHAFPGGIAVIERNSESGGQVDFADGSAVDAEWWEDGEDLILDVPSYRTAKGHPIDARRWRLIQSADGTWRSYVEPVN